MPPARPLKRARQRSSPSDNRDHDQSRPVRRRRIDRSKEVSTATASTTTMSTAALHQSERTTMSRQAGHSRLNKRTGKYSKARPVTLRPIAKVHDDASSDEGDDENELELAGLETDLLPPSSPAYGQKLPVQATFPKGRTLEGLARKLDLPPTVAPIRSLPSPQLNLNLPPLNLDLSLKHSSNFPRPSLPTQIPSHTNPHLNRSFSTPRKISGSRSFAGETTEEEQESGDENGSDILSEIEEENREYYKEMQERQRQSQVIGKGKGIERMQLLPGVHDRRLQPTVSDVTTSLKMLGSPVLIRSIPKRCFPSSTTPTPYGSGYGSPSGSSGPSSPGSLAVDEAEIERELFMDVDRASLAQEEEEERLISNMMLGGDTEDEDAETMQLPLADSVRLEHRARITALCLPTTESFSGARVRRMVRARQLGQVVEDLGTPMSMSFARLVAVKRRGKWNAAKLYAGKTIRQELVGSKSRAAGSVGSGSGYDVGMLREAMRQAAGRRSLMAKYRIDASQVGLDSTWASGTLTAWWTTLGRVEPFRSFMLYVQSEPMVRALWLLEREMQEERDVDVILPIDTAESSAGPATPVQVDDRNEEDTGATTTAVSRRRVYTDDRHLAGHEALYPEFIERYVSRLSETEPRFHQLRAWQSIDATWEARFAAQEERDNRRAAEHRRRTAERARQREEAERRVREARELEEREALMRAAQIARWEVEAEQSRLQRIQEEGARRHTDSMGRAAAVERDAAIMDNPNPPTYPAAVPIEPVVAAASLPVTPPPAAPQDLPNYSRIVYGNRSPPPPPPYNAVGGFELVEIDDLLFDDDDEDGEDEDIEDDLGPIRGNWQDPSLLENTATEPRFVGVPANQQPRILSLEEMQAEQEMYVQAEREREEAETTNRRGRCIIM
ncbi:hypothetical protein FFLO_00481 [Filobasidium floriforme]|uniref:Uncharacterized protein n=1 Tax=Filobasidium floriforme TaxID=5210 RepID=A0A8K0JS09_9TREE|nr:uncharacterized protein HD553DRAFT_318889 [Filobasidium floriforme]KAG7575317.1 hypothetical protein FFLO_00481 [Filobasidium floriforme]KAH8078890.1 hypothetical protein HD553DRAFT_318889 [Filobasidium floriforme]